MATLSITIPDAVVTRVITAVAYNNGYSDTYTDMDGNTIPNPVTKAQFCKNLIKEWVKNNVRTYEAVKAVDIARLAAVTAVDTEINLGD